MLDSAAHDRVIDVRSPNHKPIAPLSGTSSAFTNHRPPQEPFEVVSELLLQVGGRLKEKPRSGGRCGDDAEVVPAWLTSGAGMSGKPAGRPARWSARLRGRRPAPVGGLVRAVS